MLFKIDLYGFIKTPTKKKGMHNKTLIFELLALNPMTWRYIAPLDSTTNKMK